MSNVSRQRRFTVSLEEDDYAALRQLADGHRPRLKLQYVVGVAVKDLLDRHASNQFTFPLDR